MREMLCTPLTYGNMRLSVRSEDIGGWRLESEIVRRGTWCARIGGGGGLVGNNLRLIVFESSVRHISTLLIPFSAPPPPVNFDVPIGIIHSA
jgi:hypothetical protein